MTIAEIKEILCGEFCCETDRQYWVNKLQAAEDKEGRNRENAEYYKAMIKYSR